jgi:hypothetical protein
VGIKNLAFCAMEKLEHEDKVTIYKWDVINLSQATNEAICKVIDKKGQPCNQIAKFKKHHDVFCLKHSKKSQYQMSTKELNPAFIKKQNVQTLMELADKYKIPYPSSIKKQELINKIHEYIYNVCLDPIENVNASKIDLVTIGRNIQLKFDNFLTNIEGGIQSIDKIIIENQISPIANRMKTIQGMIAQYFIMKNHYIKIEFVNASNKLKWLEKDLGSGSGSGSIKTTYSERKKKSLTQTIDFLKEHGEEDWLDFFMKNKKKDDLGDCFLQALWYFFMKD